MIFKCFIFKLKKMYLNNLYIGIVNKLLFYFLNEVVNFEFTLFYKKINLIKF